MRYKPIHSGRIERWLGAERAENLSANFRTWYGPPVCIRDLPGSVWITGGGEFVGEFDRGYFGSAMDSLWDWCKRLDRAIAAPQHATCNVGFASISDALARASSGNSQSLNGGIQKSGPGSAASAAASLWLVGAMPGAGASPGAAPGGRAPTSTATGAMGFTNPASGGLHLTGADMASSIIGHSLLLYDRIFDVAKTMNSTATEAVTGVPTRYQSSTATDVEYAGGNFLFTEVSATLAATAHNWAGCLYRNQAATDNVALPSVAGIASASSSRIDLPASTWFAPLAAGDTGVMDLAQMQCSALVATGTINFVIGHPIGIMAFPLVGLTTPFDWLTNRTQAPRIINNACLAFIELPKPTATASTYSGHIYATGAAP